VWLAADAEQADALVAGGGAIAVEVAARRAFVLVFEGAEVSGGPAQVAAGQALQQGAGGVFGLQAFVGGVEHRGFHFHFAELQLGIA
jgi:hypothetical protein